MKNDSENAVTFLLPSFPFAKKRKTTWGGSNFSSEIFSTNAQDGTNKRVDKTGVEIQYHNKEEYGQLGENQKDELREWRKKSGSGKGKKMKAGSKDDDKYK